MGRILIASLAAGLILAACASESGPEADGSSIAVVASFYPLAEAAQRVGGDAAQVNNLTPPGVEPHDLELSPDQVQAIASADLVLYMGEGFQPAVQDAVDSIAEGEAVDVLAAMPLMQGSEPGEAIDPHVWLSPVLMRDLVGSLARALGAIDPDRAATFDANARGFEKALTSLDREYRAGLEECDRRVLVTSHAAFGYLAQEYDLQQEAIAGLSPEAEPSAEQLATIAADIRAQGVTTVFTETLVSPKLADTLASEAGATTAVLNPLEGLTQEQVDAGEDYLSVMRSNLEALRAGLGCT